MGTSRRSRSCGLVVIAALPSGQKLAFLARHGFGHTLLPSEVPCVHSDASRAHVGSNKANIAALKHVGVQAIVAFSAVGSLQDEIAPGDFVIPSG